MAVIAVASAKGSPGVTTAALAWTLTWGRSTVLAECDPSGGTVLAGFLRSQLPADRGLLPLAIAELRSDALAAEFPRQLIDMAPPHARRLLLPGLTDPVQAGTLAPVWERLAGFFADLEHGDRACDVIVDCGRLAAEHVPWPLLRSADTVLLAVRPFLTSIATAVPAVTRLSRELTNEGGLLVIGDGPYSPREIARGLGIPVVATVPWDPHAAAALANGGVIRARSTLLRAAAGAEAPVRAAIGRRRQQMPQRFVPQVVRSGPI